MSSINDWAARAAREIDDQYALVRIGLTVGRIAAIIALNARPLTDALRASKREHYHCDDSFYCCPLCDSDDHGGLQRERSHRPCNCGADAHNARIDAALNS